MPRMPGSSTTVTSSCAENMNAVSGTDAEAALAEKKRELADLRAQLVRAQASGPAVLTVLAGGAEEP
jgi:ribosomal protein L29